MSDPLITVVPMTATLAVPAPCSGPAEAVADRGPVSLARAAVSQALERASWSQLDRDLLDEVREIVALRAQVNALLLDAIAEVDARGLANRRGCSPTRAWLRSAHRIAPHEAAKLVSTAKSLRTELPSVAAALGTGTVSLAQADVIVTAIGDLPAQTPVARKPHAEATMIEAAATFDPMILTRIGRRLAEIVDPEGVQDRDEKPILDKEADAHRDRTVTLSPDSDGAGGYLRARLDAVGYATLTAYLQAATAPGLIPDGATPPTPAADADTRTIGQRRHDAAVEAIRQMLTGGGLPSSGGVKPRIVLTIPASSLTNRTGAARLADGTQISPTLARLLACDADLVPVTLDGDGNPLDVGRTRRLFTGPVRTALEVRDRGCAWPGCDRPVSWTQAHHIVSWQDGGKTSLDNGVLLCLFHHHEIETADWTVAIHRGRAAFTPPTWIDPDRKPRINPMHHPPPRE